MSRLDEEALFDFHRRSFPDKERRSILAGLIYRNVRPSIYSVLAFYISKQQETTASLFHRICYAINQFRLLWHDLNLSHQTPNHLQNISIIGHCKKIESPKYC